MFGGSIGEEQDNAMQRRILLRRQRDEERRIRLLNARQRVMGLDHNALQQQIEERKAVKAAEKAADALYASTNVAARIISCFVIFFHLLFVFNNFNFNFFVIDKF